MTWVAGRRVAVIAGVLALVVAGVVGLLLLSGGDDHRRPGAPAGADPLAFVPAAADVVVDLDTRAPLVALALEQLAPRLTGGALSSAAVTPLLGGRAVIATKSGRAWVALGSAKAGAAADLAKRQNAAVAVRDGVVVAAQTAGDLAIALRQAGAPAAKGARATFDRRFAGLPSGTPARVAFAPQALLRTLAPQLTNTAWARSLRDGAAVLDTSGTQLTIPFHLSADPRALQPKDLPIATGAAAPQARGAAPLVVAVRSPAQTLAFARAAGLLQPLRTLDRLPGFLRPDLGDLGPNGTITSTDLRHVTARTEPPSAGDWSTKLGRLDTLSSIAGGAGLTDIRIDRRDGVYAISQKGALVVRAGTFGRALVLSNDPRTDLGGAAAAPTSPAPPGAAGALTARLRSDAVRALLGPRLGLPDLILGRLGDLTGWARAELAGVTGELRLAIQ